MLFLILLFKYHIVSTIKKTRNYIYKLQIFIMFSLATPVYINEYKAQSNCNQSVETLALDYNLTGLCIHLYKPCRVAIENPGCRGVNEQTLNLQIFVQKRLLYRLKVWFINVFLVPLPFLLCTGLFLNCSSPIIDNDKPFYFRKNVPENDVL